MRHEWNPRWKSGGIGLNLVLDRRRQNGNRSEDFISTEYSVTYCTCKDSKVHSIVMKNEVSESEDVSPSHSNQHAMV